MDSLGNAFMLHPWYGLRGTILPALAEKCLRCKCFSVKCTQLKLSRETNLNKLSDNTEKYLFVYEGKCPTESVWVNVGEL